MDSSTSVSKPLDSQQKPTSRQRNSVSTTGGPNQSFQFDPRSTSPFREPSVSATSSAISRPHSSQAHSQSPCYSFNNTPTLFHTLPPSEDITRQDWFSIAAPATTTASFETKHQSTLSTARPLALPAALGSATFQSPEAPPSDAAIMSTVAALQFDPAFGMGSRSSYSTWPGRLSPESTEHQTGRWDRNPDSAAVLENNNSILGHDIPPSSSYGSDTSLSPPTGNRSISSNSRQAISLSAQQREIKRQREQARRDAKVTSRRRAESVASLSAVGLPPTGSTASVSTSSKTSPLMVASSSAATGSPLPLPPVTATSSPPSYMQSPPVTMADLSGVSSGPGSMPVGYATTSAPQISLLSEPVTTTSSASTSLAPPYYSPPLQDNSFSSSYQTQPCMSEYTTGGYTTAPPPPISSQYGRPMQEQPGLLYHMPQQQLPPPAPSMMGPGVQPPHGPLGHPHLVHPQAPRGHESMVPPSAQGAAPVRVVQSRPKPQCWEHGCNGRQFSTFSNLLRHQREKSGQATKAVCPNCGAEFTRTTARNGHLQHDKCKQRRNV